MNDPVANLNESICLVSVLISADGFVFPDGVVFYEGGR